jgi:TPR repeat protein
MEYNILYTFYPFMSSAGRRNQELEDIESSASLGTSEENRKYAVTRLCELAEKGKHDAWLAIYKIFYLYCTENGFHAINSKMFYSAPLRKIIQGLHKAAKHGNIQAQGWLGLEYRNGICSNPNSAAAEKWLRIAALNGCLASQYNLAAFMLTHSKKDSKNEVLEIYFSLLNILEQNPSVCKSLKFRHLHSLRLLLT